MFSFLDEMPWPWPWPCLAFGQTDTPRKPPKTHPGALLHLPHHLAGPVEQQLHRPGVPAPQLVAPLRVHRGDAGQHRGGLVPQAVSGPGEEGVGRDGRPIGLFCLVVIVVCDG